MNGRSCLLYTSFGKIPQSPELQQRILQAELDTVEETLEVLRQQGKNVSRAMLKGWEKRKHNREAKLEKVEHAIKSVSYTHLDVYKRQMKDCGSGTPATRASIIETLFKRGYMERCIFFVSTFSIISVITPFSSIIKVVRTVPI